MKKSKFLAVMSLVLVMIISLAVTACGGLSVKEIKMDENTFRGIYVVGEEIDYSKINIIAIYEDNTKSTFKLTDDGVTYTAIDTSTVTCTPPAAPASLFLTPQTSPCLLQGP